MSIVTSPQTGGQSLRAHFAANSQSSDDGKALIADGAYDVDVPTGVDAAPHFDAEVGAA